MTSDLANNETATYVVYCESLTVNPSASECRCNIGCLDMHIYQSPSSRTNDRPNQVVSRGVRRITMTRADIPSLKIEVPVRSM